MRSLLLFIIAGAALAQQGPVTGSVYGPKTRDQINKALGSAGANGAMACVGTACTFAGTVSVGTTVVTTGQQIDMLCSGDIGTSLVANIAALDAANGGTIRLSSGSCYSTLQISRSSTKTLRLTGQGPSMNGIGSGISGGTVLDLRYSGGPKISMTGAGYVEIDHLTLTDTTDGTADFIYTTNPTPNYHDLAIWGKTSSELGTMPVQRGILVGGSTVPTAFQGYPANLTNLSFYNLNTAITVGTYGNSVNIINPNIWNNCGGDAAIISDGTGATNGGVTVSGGLIEVTHFNHGVKLVATSGSSFMSTSFWDQISGQAVTSATNANPVVITHVGHRLPTGQVITISGATGGWTGINGTFTITRLSADTFSIPVNSTSFGALSGSPLFQVTTSYYTADSASGNNLFMSGFGQNIGAFVDGAGATSATIIDARSGQTSSFPSLSSPALVAGSTTSNNSSLRVSSAGSPTSSGRVSWFQSGVAEFVAGQNGTSLVFAANPAGYSNAQILSAATLSIDVNRLYTLKPIQFNTAGAVSALVNLPAAASGQMQFCADCKNSVDNGVTLGAVCVGSGSGAMAISINSTWRCY